MLPEHWIAGGGSSPDPSRNPFLAAVASVIQKYGIYCVPGTLEEMSGGTAYTTAVLLGPDGAVIGTYRKRRPTRPHHYGAGTSVGVWDTRIVRSCSQRAPDVW